MLGFAVCLGLVGSFVWLRPPTVRVADRYSAEERQEIVGAATRSAHHSLIGQVLQGRFRELWRWMSRNPWRTFHVVGDGGRDQLWLICGNPDVNAPQGYVVWSQTVLTRKDGHWVAEAN